MKIDWSFEGWRVFADEQRFSGGPPLRIIPQDVRIQGPVLLQLGHGAEANKGWVYVPDDMELELV